ncbi:MAG: hypothetical protein AB7U34_02265 [Novosphingobium sp.]
MAPVHNMTLHTRGRGLLYICVLGSCAALSACGSSDNAPGPGGVTVGEARALDEAAQMIEQRRLPDDIISDVETGRKGQVRDDTRPGQNVAEDNPRP